MAGYELSRESKSTKITQKLRNFFGPAGVFFEGFLRNPVMVGSIIPSSRFTIRKVLDRVDWDQCKLFVEYGPGVGTFCGPVLDRLPRDGTLLVIDTNPLFIDYLKRTIADSRFIAVHGSAADVEEIVRSHGHERADYILSGLPFSTLPEGVAPAIAAATYRILRKGGGFLTYQFNRGATKMTERYFDRVDRGVEWVNVPPCMLAWGWKDKEEG